MAEVVEIEKLEDIRDVSVLENKIREKIYELGIKRKLVDDSRRALSELDTEKHEQIQRAEKAERELSEIKIHLEVAIKAAREAEAERSSARELLARQRAQLEATSKERENFQQLNRSQQLEICDLKRELEDSKSKMKSQSYILDIIQKKDIQIRSTLTTLTGEILKFENSQTKLKEMCTKITTISKKIVTLMHQRKIELSLLRSEKSELEEKIISMMVKFESLVEENRKNIKRDQNKCEHILEWELAQKEMQSRFDECNREITHLQNSLDSALSTVAKYQAIDLQSCEKIRVLEEKVKTKVTNLQKENKFVQTEEENNKEVLCKPIISAASTCEIQSSEVDTCEGT